MPAFREEFGLSAALTGTIASGSFISYGVALMVASVLTPRFGGRRVAVAAGAIATVGTLMVAAAPSAALLAAGILVAGSSTGVASPSLAHAVAHAVAGRSQDRVQTFINSGTGAGIVVVVPIALMARDEWRLAWLAFAVICALVTAWVASSVPSGGTESTDSTSLLPAPLLPAGAGSLLAAAVAAGLASSAVWTFGRDVLVTEGGLSEASSLAAWALLGAFGVLGAGAGDLAQRIGLRASWVVTMLAIAAATLLIGTCPGLLPIAWLSAAIFGASYIAMSGLRLIWGTQVYADSPAAGAGLAFVALAFGQATGSVAAGATANVESAFIIAALTAAGAGAARASNSRGNLQARH